MIKTTPIPAFTDNYIWAIHDERHAILVDPGDAEPCIRFLESKALHLTAILVTHHHHDHINGIRVLFERFQPAIHAPRHEAIPHATHPVVDGETIRFDTPALTVQVIATPGHTLSHVAFYADGRLFCGDTLFSCGCGRLFEGSPGMMLSSLKRLMQLPDNTEIFCAHEYTLSNISFARTIEPGNPALSTFAQTAEMKRAKGMPTLPSTMAIEKQVNPFLRSSEPGLVQMVKSWYGQPHLDEQQVFTLLRKAKDSYRA